jgi:membrane fusion protein (multidrug efflux system)
MSSLLARGGLCAGLIGALALALAYEPAGVRATSARVEANVVPVGTGVAGVIASWQVVEGAAVKANQPIALLDAGDMQAELAVAEATLAVARATVRAARAHAGAAGSEALAGVATARARGEAARAQLASARAKAAEAKDDLARREQAFKTGAVDQETVDKARTTVSTSSAAERAAANAAAAAEHEVTAARARVANAASGDAEAAAAHVEEAEAQVALAKRRLAQASVTSPVAGTLARRLVQAGERVAANQPLAMILADGPRWIAARAPQAALPRLAPGQPVQIAIDAWPGRQWSGHVDQIGALSAASVPVAGLLGSPDPTGMGDVTLRIAIDGGGAELLPGMAAVVTIAAPAQK